MVRRRSLAVVVFVLCAALVGGLGEQAAVAQAKPEGEMRLVRSGRGVGIPHAVLGDPRLLQERVRFGPIYEYIWPSGVGPRVEDAALMKIDPYPWSVPLEDVRLKAR
jgi:hypothetical protein